MWPTRSQNYHHVGGSLSIEPFSTVNVTTFRSVRFNSVIPIPIQGTTFRSRQAGSVTRIEFDGIAKHGLTESLFIVSSVYIKTKDGWQETLLGLIE